MISSLLGGVKILSQKRLKRPHEPQLDHPSPSKRNQLAKVSFAPLKKTSGRVLPHLVHYSQDCHCGDEAEGFGNDCVKEERVQVGSSSICIFLHSAQDDITINKTTGSLSTHLGLVEWLRDSHLSGKSAGLRIAGSKNSGETLEPTEWHFNATASRGCL